jgi:hypothetical protein
MNTILWKGRLMAGLIVGVCLSSATLAANGNRSVGDLPQPPRETPQFKPGDVLAVAAASAQLMRGDNILATVPKGRQVVVVEVRDPWVGIYVSLGDQKQAGWVPTTAFVPAGGSAQAGYVAAGYSAEQRGGAEVTLAAESQAVSSPAVSAACRVSSPDYFRDYDIGYYTRHETDPNLQTWEPWMYHR